MLKDPYDYNPEDILGLLVSAGAQPAQHITINHIIKPMPDKPDNYLLGERMESVILGLV
jgi:hypothetical protein